VQKKVSLVTYYESLNNKIFDPKRRDNNSKKFIYLKNKLEENNINLQTYDINTPDKSDLSIHFDIQKNLPIRRRSLKNILVVRESPIINKYNNLKSYLNDFDLVITWNKELCDEKRIFWAGYGNSSTLQEDDPIEIYEKKKKDICMIISKKYSNERNALYEERETAINFFSKSDLDFDLYGFGWDKRQFRGLLRPLNKIPKAREFLYKPPSTFKGSVNSKAITFSNYKFSLCYENCKSNGYITEKLFDSMFAGCIPIYLGCPNIKNEIDPSTFIDLRDFPNYLELYSYLKSMTKNEYLFKINKIINFYKDYLNTTYCDRIWADFITNKCLSLLR